MYGPQSRVLTRAKYSKKAKPIGLCNTKSPLREAEITPYARAEKERKKSGSTTVMQSRTTFKKIKNKQAMCNRVIELSLYVCKLIKYYPMLKKMSLPPTIPGSSPITIRGHKKAFAKPIERINTKKNQNVTSDPIIVRARKQASKKASRQANEKNEQKKGEKR